ncbi:hypothetical protein BBW65_03680 [Helicobacter enhydrae]|uniref:Uncharacterized protein n=1 Tax=Helicobacter enhydrae TaxID=222136 RepID=A0A1B1U5A6_9HELI|nr:hypothetical protein [Helicobacter enhydrae]ANV97953.1 hypothetical protein BBW65_03680 [Helicobacter enhydrae]
MLIIGHQAIPYPKFVKIHSIQDINHTLANEIVWFSSTEDEDFHISTFCHTNQVCYAFYASTPSDLVIYANLGAKYIITHSLFELQEIARDYLLDTQILFVIDDMQEIAEMIAKRVDGVILASVLKE